MTLIVAVRLKRRLVSEFCVEGSESSQYPSLLHSLLALMRSATLTAVEAVVEALGALRVDWRAPGKLLALRLSDVKLPEEERSRLKRRISIRKDSIGGPCASYAPP